jgi:hypothetical protein
MPVLFKVILIYSYSVKPLSRSRSQLTQQRKRNSGSGVNCFSWSWLICVTKHRGKCVLTAFEDIKFMDLGEASHVSGFNFMTRTLGNHPDALLRWLHKA